MSIERSSAELYDICGKNFSKFLVERLQNAGGSLKLQHITGHLSQLPLEVRENIGTSPSNLVNFLKRHPNLFSIKDDLVTLVTSLTKDYNNDCESEESKLLPEIKAGKGAIVKLLPNYGFLKVKDPVKAYLYFRNIHFDGADVDLRDSGLNIGTMVYFNAVRTNNLRSKYNVTKIWKVNKTDENNGTIIQKTRKNRETGLYDPQTLSGEGSIQNVFANYGFIVVDGNENNRVFFYKKNLLNYGNIVDLTQVFKIGEVVEFNACRSTKRDAKVRWEAIKVWKKSGKMYNSDNTVKHASFDYKEGEESFSQSSRPESNHSFEKTHSAVSMKSNDCSKQIIRNQKGKICPRSHGAVIKFGENFSQLADGDSSTYFIYKTQVFDISWEFSEGDDVCFDAVKIKSAPGWKATLVWSGEKPDIDLPVYLGDFDEHTDAELDEIPESYSYTSKASYVSDTSYTSIQSEALKSEQSCSLKRSKQKSTELIKVPVCKSDKNSSSESKITKSFTSSQNNLCSSTESKEFQDIRRKCTENDVNDKSFMVKKSAWNWGDTEYPEAGDNFSLAENCLNEIDNKEHDKNEDDEMKHSEGYSSKQIAQISESYENIADHSPKISNFIENAKKNEYVDNLDSECKNNVEKNGSIKQLKNNIGKVIKVYSKFAEIESPKLHEHLAFFWNTLYCNGKSVNDFLSLQEFIKIGDDVNFNYFEIVDDSGQIWQKITLVWIGSKPSGFIEMTPDEFIEQNQLSVTISHTSVVESSSPVKGGRRKFLAVISDTGPGHDAEECISQTESFVESEQFSKSHLPEMSNLLSKEVEEYEPLINSINQMLLNKQVFWGNSVVDLKSLSTDIVQTVLQYHEAEESDRTLPLSSPEKDNFIKKSNLTCSICGKNVNENCRNVGTQNAEIQTIITGAIIAQTIFTEC